MKQPALKRSRPALGRGRLAGEPWPGSRFARGPAPLRPMRLHAVHLEELGPFKHGDGHQQGRDRICRPDPAPC